MRFFHFEVKNHNYYSNRSNSVMRIDSFETRYLTSAKFGLTGNSIGIPVSSNGVGFSAIHCSVNVSCEREFSTLFLVVITCSILK